ncbi:plasmid pRiA4b ORF-3 family protein [Gordonia sp. PKS22-38]|uniref:Plasmid pRiA4b ORF-3 family protein n=1 Tax=Gordonia prachuapensis TaxID=3115651 RepID=A0ABU7MUL4_9ACTN|nr:plasmid pRiA4b ORF-3 family protein [Gordonia sp. PKS22-38]
MSSDKRARRAKRAAKSRKRHTHGHENKVVGFLRGTDLNSLVGSFRTWLVETDFYENDADPAVLAEAAAAMGTAAYERRSDFQPDCWTVSDVDAAIGFAEEMEELDPDAPSAALPVFALRAFLDFLRETDRWAGPEDLCDVVMDVVDEALVSYLTDQHLDVDDVDPVEEETALSGLEVIRRLDALLAWVGSGRPATEEGSLDPTLLQDASNAIDLGMPDAVETMGDHPTLADLWVLAEVIGLIAVRSGSAEPGLRAQEWSSGPNVEMLRETAERGLEAKVAAWESEAMQEIAVTVLRRGLTRLPLHEDDIRADDDTVPDTRLALEIMAYVAGELQADGWLHLADDGGYVVPSALRLVVSNAVEVLSNKLNPVPVVTLQLEMPGIEPPVSRRVEVTGLLSLIGVHDLIQSLMSWNDSHLHRFSVYPRDDSLPFMPQSAIDDGLVGRSEAIPEDRVPIGVILEEPGAQLLYEYDFGDGWEVLVTLEAARPPVGDVDNYLLTVIDGTGTAPFDDVGGAGGWEVFVAAVTDPTHEQHAELRDWAGLSPTAPFDPTAFDVEAANRALEADLT